MGGCAPLVGAILPAPRRFTSCSKLRSLPKHEKKNTVARARAPSGRLRWSKTRWKRRGRLWRSLIASDSLRGEEVEEGDARKGRSPAGRAQGEDNIAPGMRRWSAWVHTRRPGLRSESSWRWTKMRGRVGDGVGSSSGCSITEMTGSSSEGQLARVANTKW